MPRLRDKQGMRLVLSLSVVAACAAQPRAPSTTSTSNVAPAEEVVVGDAFSGIVPSSARDAGATTDQPLRGIYAALSPLPGDAGPPPSSAADAEPDCDDEVDADMQFTVRDSRCPPRPWVPRPAARDGGVTSGSSSPEVPTRADAAASMRALQDRVRDCGDGSGAMVRMAVTFSHTGNVEGVRVRGRRTPAGVAACVTAVARSATLPPFRQLTFSVGFPFRLR